jgi:hypothetical protein
MMKKFVVLIAAISLAVGTVFANGEAAADDSPIGASLAVDIGTAHVFRGATVIDDLVIQPALELSGFGMSENYGVISVGVWGSIAPFNDDPILDFDTMYETDWYINYMLPELAEDLDLYLQYTIYQYDIVAGGLNEKEISLGAAYALGDFDIGTSLNFMVDDRNPATEDQIYFDLYGAYTIEINEKSDVTLGGLISLIKQGDGNAVVLDDGFNHYELEAAYSYALGDLWSLGASLAYIGQFSSDVLPDSAYDQGLVAFFSVGAEM